MTQISFDCAQCGRKHKDNWLTAMSECRDCLKMHCTKCLDANYLCNACAAGRVKKQAVGG
jgi:hypothetical protein